MDLQHLVLAPGVQPEVRTAPLTYDTIVATVGYPVEVINIEGGKAVMYACEEGKLKGMPRNESATKMAAGSLRSDDYVSGTALVVGPIGPGGVDTGLTDQTLNDLLAVLA